MVDDVETGACWSPVDDLSFFDVVLVVITVVIVDADSLALVGVVCDSVDVELTEVGCATGWSITDGGSTITCWFTTTFFSVGCTLLLDSFDITLFLRFSI